jgi:hypothetical protein
VVKRTARSSQLRFAAKLLFQFRVVFKGRSNQRRLCEERILVIGASSAEIAHRIALRKGRKSEHHYENNGGGMVHVEFVGILDLMHLGVECDPDEVWYDFRRVLLPKERASRLIPPKGKLSALWKSGPPWKGGL